MNNDLNRDELRWSHRGSVFTGHQSLLRTNTQFKAVKLGLVLFSQLVFVLTRGGPVPDLIQSLAVVELNVHLKTTEDQQTQSLQKS